ncbi:MAG: hypothetical protein M3186_05690 [Actinomycetota bacterium]|nr:hypothetical protein [Actinomycetota bacterium]
MPRYKQVWAEFPREQYNSLPAATQRLIDRRIAELLQDPTGDPDARYYQPHDEWSIPFTFGDEEGFIYYGVADEPRRVVILRRLVFGG